MTKEEELSAGMSVISFLNSVTGSDGEAQIRILAKLLNTAMILTETDVVQISSTEGEVRYDFAATTYPSVTEPKPNNIH